MSRPRIFRFAEDKAMINRMGFPNDGADAICERLRKLPRAKVPVGWSIGKSKVTPQEEALEDYLYSLRKLYDFADFFTVNVSSPNTPGLRQLQEKDPLDRLLQGIVQETERIARENGSGKAKSVLVKISPDLTESQRDDVVEVCLKSWGVWNYCHEYDAFAGGIAERDSRSGWTEWSATP